MPNQGESTIVYEIQMYILNTIPLLIEAHTPMHKKRQNKQLNKRKIKMHTPEHAVSQGSNTQRSLLTSCPGKMADDAGHNKKTRKKRRCNECPTPGRPTPLGWQLV